MVKGSSGADAAADADVLVRTVTAVHKAASRKRLEPSIIVFVRMNIKRK